MKPPPHRQPLVPLAIFLHDLAVAGLAMGGSFLLRYHFEPKPTPYAAGTTATLLFVAVCAAAFPLFGLHRGVWRFTALNDILRCARAAVIANLIFLPLLFLINRLEDFPRSTVAMSMAATFTLLCFGRLLARAWAGGDLREAFRLEDRALPPAVVVGSADAADSFIGAARRSADAGPHIAGIIVLDLAVIGRTIRGVPILGGLDDLASSLKAASARTKARASVIVAEPRPDRALLERVVGAAAESGASVARARAFNGGGSAVTPVGAADLLARPPRALNPAAAQGLIAGKRVLITGAGGAIGGELTLQVSALDPRQLILFDASEFNLYSIDQTLREMRAPGRWRAELGDVRDRARIAEVFASFQPEVVLHAAALKHVPLMELNPIEAVLTNIGGALNVARLATAAGANLAFISTDKAVNPTNVMGATKRVAEHVVHALAAERRAKAAVVRFGNVLGSSGSVVPLFERQIAKGGPVTVTDPRIERYFMTIQEAASLVLQAAALPAAPGERGLYVLDMGEPVKIEELARQVIRLHGLRPDKDIKIIHTGLRPGEKLFEEIFYPVEDVRATAADGVLAARAEAPSWADLGGPVEALLAAAAVRDRKAVLERLKALVPEFRGG
ncbi:MAG TPA: polysaccharide biosynthesis protein [Caulobacteraceae bacterium]|nr:polysaccharide biosynthesis protein [Caulobacteraceae bacterium]